MPAQNRHILFLGLFDGTKQGLPQFSFSHAQGAPAVSLGQNFHPGFGHLFRLCGKPISRPEDFHHYLVSQETTALDNG